MGCPDFGAHGRQPDQPLEGVRRGVLGLGERGGCRVAVELPGGQLFDAQHPGNPERMCHSWGVSPSHRRRAGVADFAGSGGPGGEHGTREVGGDAQGGRVQPGRQAALGRRGDPGADLCRDSLRRGVRRTDPDGRVAQVRLVAPAPRGFHGAVWEILQGLPQRSVVPGGGGTSKHHGPVHGLPKGE